MVVFRIDIDTLQEFVIKRHAVKQKPARKQGLSLLSNIRTRKD